MEKMKTEDFFLKKNVDQVYTVLGCRLNDFSGVSNRAKIKAVKLLLTKLREMDKKNKQMLDLD